MTQHPLDSVPIIYGNEEEVRSLLRLLPGETFPSLEKFVRGLSPYDKKDDIGIYARPESFFGKKGVSLIAVNSHLFGNPCSSKDNPVFCIPDRATNIYFVPGRMHPASGGLYAGVEFDLEGARFFFGYELTK